MFKFLSKKKNILSVEENVKLLEEKTIDLFDIDQFSENINNLQNIQETKENLKNYTKYFDTKFNNYSKMNTSDLSNNLTNILIDNELLYRIDRVLNNSMILEEIKKFLFNSFASFKKSCSEFLDKIREYRKTENAISNFRKENMVSIVVSDIFFKIFANISENNEILFLNFNTILSNIILNIQEKLNDISDKNILKKTFQKKDSEEKYSIIYPNHPLKYFDNDIESISDFIYSNINTIEKIYSLFYHLQNKINSLQNVIKRTGNKLLSRGNPGTKISTEMLIQIKNKFNKILDENINKMGLILLRNIQRLGLETDKNNKIIDFFTTPHLKIDNDIFLFVYDTVYSIFTRIRENHMEPNESIYLINNLCHSIETHLINQFNPEIHKESQFLMFLRYYNLIENLAKKFNYEFLQCKIILLKYLSKLKNQNEVIVKNYENSTMSFSEIKRLDNIISNFNEKEFKENIVIKKNIDFNLKDVLNEITNSVNIGKDIRSNTEQIDELFNKFIPKNNYEILVKFVLEFFRNKMNDEIDIEVFKRFKSKNLMPLFIGIFSNFFNIHLSIYPKFEKNFLNAKAIDLDNWLDLCQDNGKYFKSHIWFIYNMINSGLMGFNTETETIEFFNQLIPSHQEYINKEKSKVDSSLYNLLNLQEKNLEEIQEETCKHINIVENINKLYETLELDKNNQKILNEIEEQKKELGLCQVETSQSFVCKMCGLVMEQNFSYAPETFEEAEEIMMNNQMVDYATLKIIQQETENNENIQLITQYLDIVLKTFKIEKTDKISQLMEEKQKILSSDYDEIISNIANVVFAKNRFKNYLKLFKPSYFIYETQRLYQLVHDIIKFLVIFLMYDKINLELENEFSEALQIQKIFSEIQSIKNLIPMNSYTEKTKLNYVRLHYNIVVEINNNIFFRTFLQDKKEITNFEKSSKIEKLIITQNFKIKEKSIEKIEKILKDVEFGNTEDINKKLINQINDKFQEQLTNKIIQNSFQFSKPINIIDHLSKFINSQQENKFKKFFLLNQLKKLPIDISSKNWNFLSLYIYLIYNNQSEKFTNPSFISYNQNYKNIDLLSEFKKIDNEISFNKLRLFLENLYKFRINFLLILKENLNVIEMIYKFYKTKTTLGNDFVKKFIIFIGYKNLESDIVHKVLKSSRFNNLFLSTLESYYETQGKEFIEKIDNELNNYKKTIEILLKNMNNKVYMSPIDNKIFSKAITLKLYLTSKYKLITNDEYKIILPYKPIEEMNTNFIHYDSKLLICPFCPYQDSNNKIEKHISEIHLFNKKTLETYNQVLQDQYYIYLKNINSKYVLLENKLYQRENEVNIDFEKKEIEKLDNELNNIKYFQEYCFKNNTKFNLHKHNFINSYCSYCHMNKQQLFEFGTQNNEIVKNLIESIIKRTKKILNIYNLLVPDVLIHEILRTGKSKPTSDKVLNTDEFLFTENNWEKLRKLDNISITIINNIISKVENYARFFFHPENINDSINNISLDFINSLSYKYYTNKKIDVINTDINEYLNNIALSYNKKIANDIILTTENKEINKSLDKGLSKKELSLITQKINKNIIQNTKDKIKNLTKHSVKDLISNLNVYVDFDKINITNKLNTIEKYNDNSLKERTNLIKPLPKIVFKTLLDMVDNKTNLYKTKGYIFDIPSESVNIALKE